MEEGLVFRHAVPSIMSFFSVNYVPVKSEGIIWPYSGHRFILKFVADPKDPGFVKIEQYESALQEIGLCRDVCTRGTE